MKALVYTGPEAMEYRDAADPVAGPGETIVKISHVGICGSDMHAYLGHDDRRPAPLILGHEGAGTTEDGRRVTINPLVPCGTCVNCRAGNENICPNRQLLSMPPREGAFAEWITVPDVNLVEVPADMPFEKAALAEPLAVCWHAAKIGRRVLGGASRALVVGGGAIGVGSALALLAQGTVEVVVVESNETRREYLSKMGLNAVAPDDLGENGGYDIVMDAVGYDATRATSSAQVRPGGVIVHIGLGDGSGGLDVRYFTLQEVTFMGSYCYTKKDFRETVEAMVDGRLGSLDWIELRGLSEGQNAFQDIRAGVVAAPKIVLVPGN
ncbi:MAG: alcohol dehydrogenase catalytic domain-containing protein [Boseongicola sp.]|nr:alcohol dehydrogenase catalytic domain-containing protein [Boseongicola sp.]MDD9977568.1 alcohol dehydrogenase catalytic domain-containing protein [Boseongicola sp.]